MKIWKQELVILCAGGELGRADLLWHKVCVQTGRGKGPGLPTCLFLMGTLTFEGSRQHFQVVLHKTPHPERAPRAGPKPSPLEANLVASPAHALSTTPQPSKGQEEPRGRPRFPEGTAAGGGRVSRDTRGSRAG